MEVININEIWKFSCIPLQADMACRDPDSGFLVRNKDIQLLEKPYTVREIEKPGLSKFVSSIWLHIFYNYWYFK